jgi:hypothetical protein
MQSTRLGNILKSFFDDNWASPYAFAPKPGVAYPAPRVDR